MWAKWMFSLHVNGVLMHMSGRRLVNYFRQHCSCLMSVSSFRGRPKWWCSLWFPLKRTSKEDTAFQTYPTMAQGFSLGSPLRQWPMRSLPINQGLRQLSVDPCLCLLPMKLCSVGPHRQPCPCHVIFELLRKSVLYLLTSDHAHKQDMG